MFGWIAANHALGALAALATVTILARALGVAMFGRFALIVAAAALLARLLGFRTAAIVELCGEAPARRGDAARLAPLYRFALVAEVIGAAIGLLATVLIVSAFAGRLELSDSIAGSMRLMAGACLLSLRSTASGILRLRHRFGAAQAARGARAVLRLVGVIVVAVLDPRLESFVAGWAIAELLSGAAHWLALWRTGELRVLARRGRGLRRVLADNPGLLRRAVTANLAGLLETVARRLPLLLVGGLAGPAAAGLFAIAEWLCRWVNLATRTIARAALKPFEAALRSGGKQDLGGISARSAAFAAVMAGAIIAAIAVLGWPAIALIGGGDFTRAYVPLLWLTVTACVALVAVTIEPVLVAAGRVHVALAARLAAIGVLLGAAVLLTPRFGATGAALATLISAITLAVLLLLPFAYIVRDRDGARRHG